MILKTPLLLCPSLLLSHNLNQILALKQTPIYRMTTRLILALLPNMSLFLLLLLLLLLLL